LLEDVYRGYRIKVAGEEFWIARITHIETGKDAPLKVTLAKDKRPEHCRDLARKELDRYISFLGDERS
jgi:hypothetical protein